MKRLLVCDAVISEFKDVVKNFSYIKKEHLPNIFPGETSVQNIFNCLASSLIHKYGRLDGSLEFTLCEYSDASWNYCLSVSETEKENTSIQTNSVPCVTTSIAHYNQKITSARSTMIRYQASDPFRVHAILTKSYLQNALYQEVAIELPRFKYPK